MKKLIKICGLTVRQPVKVVKHHEIPEHVRVGINTIPKPKVVKREQPKIQSNWLQEAMANIYEEKMRDGEVLDKWRH